MGKEDIRGREKTYVAIDGGIGGWICCDFIYSCFSR